MTNLNNDDIKKYAEFAAFSYNIASDTIEPNDYTIVINNVSYKYIMATPHTTNNGFQAIAYGVLDTDGIHYKEIIIAFRGSMPPDNFNLNEFVQDWLINDFGDIVGGNSPSQLNSAIDFYNNVKENYLSTNGTITLTGHSLGGALVQLVAAKEGVEDCRLGVTQQNF